MKKRNKVEVVKKSGINTMVIMDDILFGYHLDIFLNFRHQEFECLQAKDENFLFTRLGK